VLKLLSIRRAQLMLTRFFLRVEVAQYLTCTVGDVDAVLLPPCLLSIKTRQCPGGRSSSLVSDLLDFHPALHILQHHKEGFSCAEVKSSASFMTSFATVIAQPLLSVYGLPSSRLMMRLETVY
jgi:hypothetical protein